MKSFEGIAKSPAIKKVLQQAYKFAPINRPILIRGERGVGKELIARFVHNNSSRADKPMVTINCAAVSEELLDAEIYGHDRGSFTGAIDSRIGKLEQANGGTLFLDEVGNMSVNFQEKLLRVMEYQQFERVRGTRKIKVDVRIVAATNANLEELMEANLFRRDFYDRLTFAELKVPPLRHRTADIPEMILHFVRRLHEEIPNLQIKQFRKVVIDSLMDYYWPGNIRELKNVIERIYLSAEGTQIKPADLPPEINGTKVIGNSFHERVEAFKQQLILEALQCNGGRQNRAADDLQMSYDQFRHYYKKYCQI